MSITPSDSISQIEEFGKQKQIYLKNFQEYLSQLPKNESSGLADLSLDDKQLSEVDHVYKDSLGCRLDQHIPPKEDFDTEEAHLKTLADKFSNKLPYLNDWLAAFQERRAKAETMPSNKEDETSGHLTDQVAKESSDSTASDHHTHQVDTGAKEGGNTKATAQDHNAAPGIVQTNNELPEKKGKEELKARAAELNK